MMRRFLALFDRYAVGALVLTLGVGWALWRTNLEHESDYKRDKKDRLPKREKVRRWLRTSFWPEDGAPGVRGPTDGNFGNPIRYRSYDWLFLMRERLRQHQPPQEACIVYLDEASHARMGQPMNEPWDRRIHARLVDRLSAAGAKAIVFDIIFLEQKRFVDPEGDKALAEAVARAGGKVVAAMSTKITDEAWGHRGTPGAIPPFKALVRALKVADPDRLEEITLGFPQLVPSYDQVVRRHPPSYPPSKHSLEWSVSSLLRAPVTLGRDEAATQEAEKVERWVNYYGPPGRIASVSMADVLDPAAGQGIPDAYFRDRIVFVGSSTLTKFSGERKDSYVSPYAALADEREQFMAGVEIHATVALNLVRGDWLMRMDLRWVLLIVVVTGLSAGPGLLQLRAVPATGAALGGVLLVGGASYWFFESRHLWFGWLIPVVQIGVGWLYSLVFNSLRLFLRNQRLLQSLSSYLSPKLARKFAGEKAEELMRPGATKHEVTVFFSDIAGFTSISEGLDPDDLAHMMNQYFETAVGQCVFPTDGTVVKFIGDAIFAIWNAPDPQPDHAYRACDAALRFRQQAVQESNGRKLVTRIGLHTGEANVGNFGSRERFDYTAFGENINLASRMESLNKYLGTLTLLTGATYAKGGDQFLTRPIGRLVLKGFEKAVEVHELVGTLEQRAGFAELHVAFPGALAGFQAGRLDAAEAAFKAVEERWPGDGPTKFYLKTITELREHPPAAGWTGEVELKEK